MSFLSGYKGVLFCMRVIMFVFMVGVGHAQTTHFDKPAQSESREVVMNREEAAAWKQPWFWVLIIVLLSALGFQTGRVMIRDHRLRVSNEALAKALNDVFAANEEIRIQTERKSQFLSMMSHELRTPLTAIKGYTENLLDGIGGELNDRQRRSLSRVRHNSEHMLSLVNDLLDLARIEAGRVEIHIDEFDVRDLIEACCDTAASLVKPNVVLRHEVADDVGYAETDQGRVRQIVINLLSNALKFTDEGEVKVTVKFDDGRWTIDDGQKMDDDGQRTTDDGRQMLEIAVSDTGKGIPAEQLTDIFEEFKQVKASDPEHKGTGLGLPISKGFAELMGGSIDVVSEVGKGSTFTLRIPRVYEDKAAT